MRKMFKSWTKESEVITCINEYEARLNASNHKRLPTLHAKRNKALAKKTRGYYRKEGSTVIVPSLMPKQNLAALRTNVKVIAETKGYCLVELTAANAMKVSRGLSWGATMMSCFGHYVMATYCNDDADKLAADAANWVLPDNNLSDENEWMVTNEVPASDPATVEYDCLISYGQGVKLIRSNEMVQYIIPASQCSDLSVPRTWRCISTRLDSATALPEELVIFIANI